MRFYIVFVFGLLLFLMLLPNLAIADNIVNSDGYVAQDGLYYKNGVAYTRDVNWYKNWVWVNASCYSCGYWTYTWAYNYVYTPIKLVPGTPDFRARVLEIAAARDKIEGRLREAAQQHALDLELVNALGMQGNFRFEAYGRNPVSPTAYGNLQLSSAGINGNTVFGYSYTHAVDAYGQTDLNALYQQASKHTENAQALANQAGSEFNELVKQAGGNAARIAEILAKAQAGRQIIDGIKGTPETKSTTTVTTVGQAPVTTVTANGNVKANVEFVKLSGPSTCIACHSGSKLEGNFDISKVPTMSADDIVTRVLPRLIKDTPEKPRMPLKLPPLTGEQIRQFLGGS